MLNLQIREPQSSRGRNEVRDYLDSGPLRHSLVIAVFFIAVIKRRLCI
jgi:hypothetical protein